ncbi:class I SAM-dependent methyltransferase [Hydrogenophaga sp.]|uniref:SAM-dependent methyltransferase n=1 Tax=Hydrogenophaga sp. TaxID=1904254 RepID=UPI00260F46FB|nr:class I SAM-dependent methyltransferase [Hydrogenophaga sp.]
MFDSQTPGSQRFDALFRDSDDPWHFKTRWYEARKRALTLACLPAARYAHGFEPGCANGELSAELAQRCDRLLVSDISQRAVELARARLADVPHATVVQAQLPRDWPDASFDLIVISELGYFLDAQSLDGLADLARASLRPGGTVLACHWRRPIQGCALDGDSVHSRLSLRMNLTVLTELREADITLHVWSDDARSVAQREGFDL